MKAKTEQLLSKSQDAIEAAETLRDADKNNFAAGRAYYAMFYVAEALLFERDMEFRKHSGVHAAYGKHFAKTKELDPKFHRYLLAAFESRLEADYGVSIQLSKTSVNEIIEQAKEFLQVAKQFLTEKNR